MWVFRDCINVVDWSLFDVVDWSLLLLLVGACFFGRRNFSLRLVVVLEGVIIEERLIDVFANGFGDKLGSFSNNLRACKVTIVADVIANKVQIACQFGSLILISNL
jgi:hypothetical protein